MHARDKADDRGKRTQRHHTMATGSRADPSSISGNLVGSIHLRAMQSRQLTDMSCVSAGTDRTQVLDFPSADFAAGTGFLDAGMRISRT
jgi:hypothetical protein